MGKGWGYVIDYDRAIASDDAELALYGEGGLVQRVALAWAAVAERWGAAWNRPTDAITVLWGASLLGVDAVRDVTVALAVAPTDLLAVIACQEWEVEPGVQAAIDAAFNGLGAARRRAEADGLAVRLGDVMLLTDTDRLRLLRTAMSRRSAHLRNRAKHGSTGRP